MRELDRELGRQPPPAHLAEDVEVVIPHGPGLGGIAHLLAELREQRPQAGPGEIGGGVERRREVFAREEAPRGAPEEGAAPQLVGEPGAARGAEQESPGEGHDAVS